MKKVILQALMILCVLIVEGILITICIPFYILGFFYSLAKNGFIDGEYLQESLYEYLKSLKK